MPWRLHGLSSGAGVVLDRCLALGLASMAVVEVLVYGASDGSAWGAATLGLAGLVLVVRRRRPLLVMLAVFACGALSTLTGSSPNSVAFAATTIVAFYTLGVTTKQRQSWAGLTLGMVICALIIDPGQDWLTAYLAVALTSCLVPWLLGALVKRRRLDLLRTEQRDQLVADLKVEERQRLARDLHDHVSHTLAMISVQAQAAEVQLDTRPEDARAAITAIQDGARDSMVEMRRLLGLLKEPGPEGSGRLSGLDALAERVGTAGVSVTVRTTGEVVPLDPAVDATAYRIVQEGLTNVVRHSGSHAADVRLDYRDECVFVAVSNPGTGDDRGLTAVEDAGDGTRPVLDDGHGPSRGLGLPGMGERVSALGGTLRHGVSDDGGYVVEATLPTPGRSR